MSGTGTASSRHAAIAATLRARIASGELRPGAAVASESRLGAEFGVSRGTVRQALAALRGEGLISGGRGRRAVVSRPTLAQSFDELISFSAWAESLGRQPGARTLELGRQPVDLHDAAALEIEPGAEIVRYRRLRLLDGEPAMIELSTFVERVGRLLFDCDLDHGSVYAQLAGQGVRFQEAEHTIVSVAAGADQASLLGVSRRAPLLQVSRRVLDHEGRPLELSSDTYRADEFAITIHNRAASPGAGVGLSLVP